MAEENNQKKSMEDAMKTLKDKYQPKEKLPSEIPDDVRKDLEKTRTKLDKLKKDLVKKYPFIMAIGITPPQAAEKIEQEEAVPEEEKKNKPIHLLIVVPEEKFKSIPKFKPEMIKMANSTKMKLWIHVKTPVDIFNYCLDSKFELVSAYSMSFPLYDKGFLGGLRVSEIHKSLVLRKFEKYVVSYILAGSFVRGDATKTSDVDVYIVIDDTDVKRMPRLELKEKLRSIIYSYIIEASELAGVRNKLNVQIDILTHFWESVKDAQPVIFTFIRDGVPLYDRGTFLPWKLLLKMGKLKPSPEAIDMFMSMGDKVAESVKRRLLDIAIGDIYWGVLTPSQAMLMLYGLPPPTTKETAPKMKEIFVDKEKMLEKKYVDILAKVTGLYKDYEHEKVKEVSGKQVDELLKGAEEYMKRLKELRVQIEKRFNQKTVEEIYNDVMKILKAIFGSKSEDALVKEFEAEFIKKGKLPENYLRILTDVVSAKNKFKQGKLDRHAIENARKNASILINHLIEYNQRCELISLQKGRIGIKAKDKNYELVITDKSAFLLEEGKISKITTKLVKSDEEEFKKALLEQKNKSIVKSTSEVFAVLKKELGDFEILF
ncbi:MAG: nucleotidyltransferase domain-containing protein [archaeon]